MEFQKSRTVEEGSIVTLHGRKFIRCSYNRRPVGVFTKGGSRMTLRLDGETETTVLPEGVVMQGAVMVKGGYDATLYSRQEGPLETNQEEG